MRAEEGERLNASLRLALNQPRIISCFLQFSPPAITGLITYNSCAISFHCSRGSTITIDELVHTGPVQTFFVLARNSERYWYRGSDRYYYASKANFHRFFNLNIHASWMIDDHIFLSIFFISSSVCTFFDLLLYHNYSFKGCEYNNLRVENVLFSFFTLMGIICWELWNRSSNNNKLHSQRNKSGKNYFQTHTPLTLALLTKSLTKRDTFFESWRNVVVIENPSFKTEDTRIIHDAHPRRNDGRKNGDDFAF